MHWNSGSFTKEIRKQIQKHVLIKYALNEDNDEEET